jgi:hypothetical protein
MRLAAQSAVNLRDRVVELDGTGRLVSYLFGRSLTGHVSGLDVGK